jgi:Putative transposase of IS4/5 family (DUF4096)
MWTPTTRQQHSRPVTRYQTDLTDAEWRVIARHLPKPCVTGRPRTWPMHEIVNGIFYVMHTDGIDSRTWLQVTRSGFGIHSQSMGRQAPPQLAPNLFD